jgi:Ca2+-binding RTX toxin-like protein
VAALGGAIFSASANLTVERALISNNSSVGANAGGGIYLGTGSLTVRSSTISGNSADRGAGIDSIQSAANAVTIENSTISGNHAARVGGGISFQNPLNNGARLDVRSSTISGNTVATGTYGGGGIFVYAGLTSLANTIVADNTAPVRPDIRTYNPAFPVSAAFSLIENPADAAITGGPNITGQDPKLGVLGDNGGPTPTIPLLDGSPALDAGLSGGLATDQRGAPRPFDLVGLGPAAGGDNGDIGAYERVLCAGRLVNRVGTAGADTLTGTPGSDGVLGLGGKDKLKGLAGKDSLCGGPGPDTLKGGKGNDTLLGQAGKDTLIGGKGKDKLRGGKGKDKQKQ